MGSTPWSWGRRQRRCAGSRGCGARLATATVTAAAAAAAAVVLFGAATAPRPVAAATTFFDASAASGLPTTRTRKYGGPVVASIANGLGAYDLLLPNHDSDTVWYYINDGRGTFRRGPDLFKFVADVHGVAVGDADLDGLSETLVTFGGANGILPSPVELLSMRRGFFRNVTVSAGLRGPLRRGRSPRLLDVDGSGTADVVLINFRGIGTEPDPLAGAGDSLQLVFDNQGRGRYAPVPAGGGLNNLPVERVLVTDLDGDGLPELIVFPFFRIFTAAGEGDVRFVDATGQWLARVSDGRRRLSPAFAAAEVDFDGDGWTDLYVAMGPKPDMLLRNDRGRRFFEVGDAAGIPNGVDDHRGVAVGDLDNDGHEDLFVVRHDVPRARDYILWNNGGNGTFTVSETHGATTSPDNGRGDNAVIADLNGDGALDVVVANGDFQEGALAGTWSLYRNNADGDAAGRHYLAVRVGRSPSTTGGNIGAVVTLLDAVGRVQWRRVGAGGSSFSQSLLNVAHFGLGDVDEPVQVVRVRWSSGEEARVTNVSVDQLITIGT